MPVAINSSWNWTESAVFRLRMLPNYEYHKLSGLFKGPHRYIVNATANHPGIGCSETMRRFGTEASADGCFSVETQISEKEA